MASSLKLRRWVIQQVRENGGAPCAGDYVMRGGYSHPSIREAEFFYTDKDAAVQRMRYNLSPEHWGLVEVGLDEI